MPPRRRAKAKAMPRSDQERVRDVPLDELRERQEFGRRPEGEQIRSYHIAGRLNVMYSHDDPAFFIPCANRLFREEPDLTAGLLEDFVPATKGKGKGAVGKGLTVTRAGRSVRMTGEAGHRLSLAMDDLSTLLMPGDILQNDDHIAAGHPGVEYLGNEGKGKGKGSPQPFTGQGNRLGE